MAHDPSLYSTTSEQIDQQNYKKKKKKPKRADLFPVHCMEKYCVLTILSFIAFNYSIGSGVKMSFLEDPNVICILSGGSLVIYFFKNVQ